MPLSSNKIGKGVIQLRWAYQKQLVSDSTHSIHAFLIMQMVKTSWAHTSIAFQFYFRTFYQAVHENRRGLDIPNIQQSELSHYWH